MAPLPGSVDDRGTLPGDLEAGDGTGDAHGHLGFTAQGLVTVLPLNAAPASSPVALALDHSSRQQLPIDVQAWPHLSLQSRTPFAFQVTSDSHGPKHAAPSPTYDMTVLALLFSEEAEV